ncbi:MAG: nicotinate-nucleotide adenylyltransferase [Cryomorphaceae bacterium]|nr:nicotinate-nucleotide adenylyltransferase [Cryomorphaceae bacterium]
MTGLFFGSFNPIHVGHMIVAQAMYFAAQLDEVWFVVSPHNPHKKKDSLLDQYHRLDMVALATKDISYLRASNIEFQLPQPSYTIDSLDFIKKTHPEKEFGLILGSDSLINLHKWKAGERILSCEELLIYPRPGHAPGGDFFSHKNVHIYDLPLIEISSSSIRKSIQNQKPLSQMLPESIWKHIDEQLFYR